MATGNRLGCQKQQLRSTNSLYCSDREFVNIITLRHRIHVCTLSHKNSSKRSQKKKKRNLDCIQSNDLKTIGAILTQRNEMELKNN